MKTLHALLVIVSDRHVDDLYRAAATLHKAEAIAKDLMEKWWGGRYRKDWKREPDNERVGWYFIHKTFDDGPRLHLERLEVEGL